ncbi:MAG: hypothetical protein AAF203_06330, partial [Pseudomonadota bacterium]
ERKPVLIIPYGGYLGKMKVGSFGELSYSSKFLSYKTDNPIEGAAQLTREFFNELEEVEDKSFDCLATGLCRMIFGDENQANIVMVFPKAVFLLAKTEFQLSEVRIINYSDLGELGNNVDLLSGDILVPEKDPILLGSTHKEIFDRLDSATVKSTPQVFVQTSSVGYSWSGFWYSFHRSNFADDVKAAEPSDIAKTMSISSEFPSYVTLKGSRILVRQSTDDVSFRLESTLDAGTADVDDVSIGVDEVESKLKMSTRVLKSNSLKFVRKFSQFLVNVLKADYDVVNYRVFGFQNDDRVNKEIFAIVSAYDQNQQGIELAFEVSEEQERLSFINVSQINNDLYPFNSMALPVANQDVDRAMEMVPLINKITGQPVIDPVTGEAQMVEQKKASFETLAGVQLNDPILLTDLDALGRQEASIQMLGADGTPAQIKTSSGELAPQKKTRGFYAEQSYLEVPVDNRPEPRNQGFVRVAGAVLGVKVIAGDATKAIARVVSINSNSFYGEIKDLCGLGDEFSLEIGMKDTKVKDLLDKAVASRGKDFKCRNIQINDSGSKGRLSNIYFPNERMILNFSDRALSSVTIYMPINDVNPAIPGADR